MRKPYVYILSNVHETVFYVGVTSDIKRRVYEHRNHLLKGFTDRYNITKVLFVESWDTMEDAIAREKQLKNWNRDKKTTLINTINPTHSDLYDEVMRL